MRHARQTPPDPAQNPQLQALLGALAAAPAAAPAVPRMAYTVEEAAEALGIGRPLAFDLIKSGQLRSVKLGSRRLVPLSALRELLDGPPGEPPVS